MLFNDFNDLKQKSNRLPFAAERSDIKTSSKFISHVILITSFELHQEWWVSHCSAIPKFLTPKTLHKARNIKNMCQSSGIIEVSFEKESK